MSPKVNPLLLFLGAKLSESATGPGTAVAQPPDPQTLGCEPQAKGVIQVEVLHSEAIEFERQPVYFIRGTTRSGREVLLRSSEENRRLRYCFPLL